MKTPKDILNYSVFLSVLLVIMTVTVTVTEIMITTTITIMIMKMFKQGPHVTDSDFQWGPLPRKKKIKNSTISATKLLKS